MTGQNSNHCAVSKTCNQENTWQFFNFWVKFPTFFSDVTSRFVESAKIMEPNMECIPTIHYEMVRQQRELEDPSGTLHITIPGLFPSKTLSSPLNISEFVWKWRIWQFLREWWSSIWMGVPHFHTNPSTSECGNLRRYNLISSYSWPPIIFKIHFHEGSGW